MTSAPRPTHVPNDVVDWVTDTFYQCNARISEKLTNNPNLPEESLDLTWIEHFSQFTSPVMLVAENELDDTVMPLLEPRGASLFAILDMNFREDLF
jgi:hypothetical protein